MQWLSNIIREVYGLFVDDGSFAVAILIWLALVVLLMPRLPIPESVRGVLLFAGLGVILADSTARYARSSRRKS